MSLFPRRTQLPPSTNSAKLDSWLREINESINANLASYGEMYYPFSESVTTMSSVATSYSTFTKYLSADTYLNLSYSTTSGLFTINQSGMYRINFNISCSAGANQAFDFELHKNDSEISHGVRLNIGTANDIKSATITAIQRLTEDDTVSVHVKSDNGTDLGTYTCGFGVQKIAI